MEQAFYSQDCTIFACFLNWKLISRVTFKDVEDMKKTHNVAALHHIKRGALEIFQQMQNSQE